MKASLAKTHVSKWACIEILKLGETLRVYTLDRTGRLNPADVPRNPRRALSERRRARPIPETAEQPLTLPSESEDPFIAIDLPSVNWGSTPEIADLPLAEVPQLNGIDEECFVC
jgi:hypothetical protein